MTQKKESLELLRLDAISKSYPSIKANDKVSLTVDKGQIHALLGENGAGKSTLVKIIYGILQPDTGSIWLDGEYIKLTSPAHARSLGIGMVFQHFSLFEAMTVAENIAVGLPSALCGKDLSERIAVTSKTYGLPLEPDRSVASLSVGERQRVEIVRCLLQHPRLLIMDEPTSVLTPQEAETLFDTLRQLVKDEIAILYISHRLEEVRKLCHHATIMRQGKVVTTLDPAKETAKSLAEKMMGRTLVAPRVTHQTSEKEKSPLLIVDRLNLTAKEHNGINLQDINLELYAGEIMAIAGLAGNGQSELMAALTGEQLLTTSEKVQTLRFKNESIGHLSPAKRRLKGLAFVPEERLGHGAVDDMALWMNTLLSAADTKRLMQSGVIKKPTTIEFSKAIIFEFNVKTTGSNAIANALSGGNLQKFIMGREILQTPELLIVFQPSWGVDAGSAALIHQDLLDLAADGTAILILSQDLDEIFTVADRIAVIANGRLSQPVPATSISADEIGLLMGGVE